MAHAYSREQDAATKAEETRKYLEAQYNTTARPQPTFTLAASADPDIRGKPPHASGFVPTSHTDERFNPLEWM